MNNPRYGYIAKQRSQSKDNTEKTDEANAYDADASPAAEAVRKVRLYNPPSHIV